MASNQLRQHAAVKRHADGIMVNFEALTVDPGWNVRVRDAALEEHIESIKRSLLGGAKVPPLQIYVNDKNEIVIVDGHCRREAIERARAEGLEYNQVLVTEFTGNDADRIAAMFTSSQGKSLTPYEQALTFKRLRDLNWSVKQISARTGKSEAHIGDMLKLADANTDVHEMVKTGEVSVDAAVAVVKKSGGGAGKVLKEKVAEANKNTKPGDKKVRVTKRHVDDDYLSKPMQQVMRNFYKDLKQHCGKDAYAEACLLLDADEASLEGQTVTVPMAMLVSLVRVQRELKKQ